MSTLNRRSFVQLSSGAIVATASSKLFPSPQPTLVSRSDGIVSVRGANYVWEYAWSDDIFRLVDGKNRVIVSGYLQPAVVVAPAGHQTLRLWTAGKPAVPSVESNRITFEYQGVNGNARLLMTWRFDDNGAWTEPIIYDSPTNDDVVSLHYFVSGRSIPAPSLRSSYFVVPGISEASTISPIVRDIVGLDVSVWLGRGSPTAGFFQQWGLPVHYFCGFTEDSLPDPDHNTLKERRSDAFVCGLADLPGGDLFLQLSKGKCGPWIDYRSDLWKHLRGPGSITLGASFLWTVGADYYGAIAGYYQGLLRSGIIRRKHNSARKTQIVLTPQFCTWGAQVEQQKQEEKQDEEFLTDIYKDLKASGMKAGLFSIDDKWERAYGTLEHSTIRFPNFEKFLDKLRADGFRVGIWAAIMRCEQPSDLGLTEDQMLKRPDGTAYVVSRPGKAGYYILDFTRPEVAKAVSENVRKFIRRYKPDVFKFDFGYEMPPVGIAAPLDKKSAGEQLMARGLDVVIKAMRQENPDQVVMYYNLSPLFLEYFDLHSPDDLFLDVGDYDVEANRRFFFSSLLGLLGVPTYGSSGYDWASAPNIWFDSAAVGTIGFLNNFRGDEEGETGKPELVARYNGIAQVLRSTNTFEIVPLDTIAEAPTLGAHARSWARYERGELVLLAWRPPILDSESSLPHATKADLPDGAAVHSRVPVVIASRDSESLTRSKSLAVAPYGGGEIIIRREFGKQAEIASHYFGGTVLKSNVLIEGDRLKLIAQQSDSAGMPLEWMDVRIS